MTDRTCPQCGVPAVPAAAFCSECGSLLTVRDPDRVASHAQASAPVGAGTDAAFTSEDPTEVLDAPETSIATAAPPLHGQLPPRDTPPPRGSHETGHQPSGYAPPPPGWGYGPPAGGPPPGFAPAPYQPAPPPARRGGGATVVALVVASIVALAGVAAAVLIAVGGSGDDPVQATNAAQTEPRTVTEFRDPPREPRRQTPRRSRPRSNGTAPRQSNPTPRSTPTPIPTPTSTASTPSTPRLAERAAVENTVERHWQLIESGQYDAAFDSLMIPQSRAGWVAEHEKDALSDVDVSVSATVHSSTSATAQILNLRTVANSGCFTWTGSYDMTKSGGDWKISKSNLSRSAC